MNGSQQEGMCTGASIQDSSNITLINQAVTLVESTDCRKFVFHMLNPMTLFDSTRYLTRFEFNCSSLYEFY